MGVTKAMIAGVRLIVKFEFGICPVKFSGVNHDSTDTGAMSPHPFGQRVDHDIGTVIDALQQEGRRKSGIDN